MFEYEFGSIVISKAGHDKGKYFIILKEDPEYVYLSDGKYRPVERPKRKKKKHVQCVRFTDGSLADKKAKNEAIINEDVKRAIKLFKNKQLKTKQEDKLE